MVLSCLLHTLFHIREEYDHCKDSKSSQFVRDLALGRKGGCPPPLLNSFVLLFLTHPRSPHRKRGRGRADSAGGAHDGQRGDAGRGGGEEGEAEPEDEETMMMRQMMGFSKFDTTKVCKQSICF